MIFIRKIPIVFALLFCPLFISAEQTSDNFHFSLSFLSGIKYGEITKSLYLTNKNTKVSQLDWQEKPIYEVGVASEIGIKNFIIDLKFSAGLPLNCGKMYDSDWNLNGTKITYSIHENDLKQSFDTELFLKWKTPKVWKFHFNPSVGLKYLYQNFNAHNGYGWYGAAQYAKDSRDYDVAWDDPQARKAKLLRDIDYFRHTLLTFIGLEVYFIPIEKLHFSLSYYISPFAFMHSIDTHHRSEINTHYLDTQNGFFSKHKTSLNVQYFFNKKLSLSTNFSFLFGTTDYGDLYADVYSDSLTKFDNQPTSSNIFNFDFDIKLTWHLK